MKKAELEFALRRAGEIAREKDFIIFGSQAIWSVVSNAPKIVVISSEVDLYPRNNLNAVSLLVRELGPRTPFFQKHGYYVDCVDPGVATLPDGWTERLVPFRTKNTGGVTGWCVEIHDLVASKLVAGRDKDFQFVTALYKSKLVHEGVLINRIEKLPVSDASKLLTRNALKIISSAAN